MFSFLRVYLGIMNYSFVLFVYRRRRHRLRSSLRPVRLCHGSSARATIPGEACAPCLSKPPTNTNLSTHSSPADNRRRRRRSRSPLQRVPGTNNATLLLFVLCRERNVINGVDDTGVHPTRSNNVCFFFGHVAGKLSRLES